MNGKKIVIQHERLFLDQFKPDWEKMPRSYFEKIPDSGGAGQKFIVKRPYDVVASAGGKFFAIEAKYSGEPELLLSKVEPHQWRRLMAASRGGFTALILCCYMYEGKVSIARFFDAEKALWYFNNGTTRMPNTDELLKVYRIDSHWQITEQDIEKL